jgi:hypothetical protein
MTGAVLKAIKRDNSGAGFRLPGDSKKPDYMLVWFFWKISLVIISILSISCGIIALLKGEYAGIFMIALGLFLFFVVLKEKISKEKTSK